MSLFRIYPVFCWSNIVKKMSKVEGLGWKIRAKGGSWAKNTSNREFISFWRYVFRSFFFFITSTICKITFWWKFIPNLKYSPLRIKWFENGYLNNFIFLIYFVINFNSFFLCLGILGFSQGATMAAHICAPSNKQGRNCHCGCRRVALILKIND